MTCHVKVQRGHAHVHNQRVVAERAAAHLLASVERYFWVVQICKGLERVTEVLLRVALEVREREGVNDHNRLFYEAEGAEARLICIIEPVRVVCLWEAGRNALLVVHLPKPRHTAAGIVCTAVKTRSAQVQEEAGSSRRTHFINSSFGKYSGSSWRHS